MKYKTPKRILEAGRKYREKNKEKERLRGRVKYQKYKDKYKQATKDRYKRNKRLIFEAYGGKCICCGEKNHKFLTLDHVNNDGNVHRKQNGGVIGGKSIHIYRWVIKNNYPNTIQLMCYNCNCGRDKNGGICPHKE